MKKVCKKHGLTECVKESTGYHRCKKCRQEAVTRKRQKIKKKLIELHGGKCSICGYNKSIRALHFHHIDPTKKQFGIAASGCCRAFDKILKEADKCLLVCSNCHCEIEDGLIDIIDYIPQ
jgi:hypothetical protein